MKRRDLLQHGCHLLREGGEHSIWENPSNKRRTAVPRHGEIPDFTALRICKQLEVPLPDRDN